MPVRPGGATDPATRIERLVAQQASRFRDAFLLATQTITDQTTLDELADLLEAGRVEEALEGLQAAAQLIGGQYGASLSAAAINTAAWLSNEALTVAVSFDVSNVRAVRQIRNNQFRLIREFTDGQRDAVRSALLEGVADGLNPRQQARAFRQSIGLTARQQQSVSNFRRLLTGGAEGQPLSEALRRQLRDGRSDRSILRAIRDSEALPAEQVDAMVDRYATRFRNYRAEVIGRTEALRAVHQGSEEMYAQAIELGQIDADAITRRWNTASDARVRDSHTRLAGLERGIGETFPADDGPLRFPGDPDGPASETVQCRCALSTRLSG